MKGKYIENDYLRFWFENGILFSSFHDEIEVDLEMMKTIIKTREDISGEEKQYWLYDITNVKKHYQRGSRLCR